MRGVLAILLLSSCAQEREEPWQGTAVGNPGNKSCRLANMDGITLESATIDAQSFTWEKCDGSEVVADGGEVNLLAAPAMAIPEGEICGLRVAFSGPADIVGTGNSGEGAFSLELELDDLRMDMDAVTFDGGDYILEFAHPGWADPTRLNLDGDIAIGPADPLQGTLVNAFRHSSMFEDANADGEISADERIPVAFSDESAASRFLFVGDAGITLQTWDSGTSWSEGTAGDQNNLGVAYGDGTWVAVGGIGTARILTSEDGETWTDRSQPGAGLNDVAWGEGRFVAVGQDGETFWSADGEVWTDVDSGHVESLEAVTFGGGQFVAVGITGARASSADGSLWDNDITGGPDLFGVAYGEGVFVAIGEYGRRIRSIDNGQTWIDDQQGGEKFHDIAYGGGTFVAVGDDGNFNTPDGLIWDLGSFDIFYSVAYGNGLWFAGGNASPHWSTNSETWVLSDVMDDWDIRGVAFAP